MSNALKVYDPASIIVVWNNIKIEGFSPNGVGTLTPNAKSFALKVGCSGESVISKSNDKTFGLKLTLMQTSASNDLLSAAHALNVAAPNAPAIGPLIIKDLNGRTLAACAKAVISGWPEQGWANEVGDREWDFFTTDLVPVVGGN